MKLLMLELIVGLGTQMGGKWALLFRHGVAQPATYVEVVGAALIFAMLAWQIPNMAASLLNGASTLTAGTALSAIGGAAIGARAASAAAAGAMAPVKGVADIAKSVAKSAMSRGRGAGAQGGPTDVGGQVGPSGSGPTRSSTAADTAGSRDPKADIGRSNNDRGGDGDVPSQGAPSSRDGSASGNPSRRLTPARRRVRVPRVPTV